MIIYIYVLLRLNDLWYFSMKSGCFFEIMEKIIMCNIFSLEVDISFCYLEDSKGEIFILDLFSMVFKSGEL